MASDSDTFFADFLLRSPENTLCFDCKEPNPSWASVNHGILICTTCVSLHRALGSQVSLVRSVKLDMWTEKQIALMDKGGNDALNTFFVRYNLNTEAINMKYMSRAALQYRKKLVAEAAGDEQTLAELGDLTYSEGRMN
jgi:hypothetical protein